jgi:dihydrolipoamide dehydrogenase
MEHYDIIVVGGGTGGLRAAIIAAKSDFKTALIEPGDIGGTCLNTGCIPTKTLLHAAERYRQFTTTDDLGIHGDPTYSFNEIMHRMHEIVTTGRNHAEASVQRIDNLTHYDVEGEFTGEDTIMVGDEEIAGHKFIIATGSSPWTPPIDGLDDTGYLDNASTLQLDEQPDSLIMIGGGYISCELACFFQSLGTDVTILERLPRVLSMLDWDVSKYMQERLENLGVTIHTNVDIKHVDGTNGDGVALTTTRLDKETTDTTYEADYLFVSTGRRPNLDIGLDAAGIDHDKHGITVNDHLQTSHDHIYAIGDVNGKAPFAHAAKREARVALENGLLDKDHTVTHDTIPWAVFTHPTIGGVGMTEKQAKEDHDIGVMRASFNKVGKAKIIQEPEGFVKVVYDRNTRDLLGTVIVGPDAHNLIHEFALLLNTPDPKIDYVLDTVHVHPTLAEVMTELKEE